MKKISQKVLSILDARQKSKIVILGIMMLIGGTLESFSVALVLPLVQALMMENAWKETWYNRLLCNAFHITNQKMYLEVLIILLIIMFILKNAFLLLEYYVQNTFIARNRFRLQKELMHNYLHKPYSFFLKVSSGEIIRVIMTDTSHAYGVLSNLLIVYTEAIVSAILAITLIIISPLMAITVIGVLLLEVFFLAKILKPLMAKMGEKSREEMALANTWILQAIGGIKSIKVANKEKYFEERYSDHAYTVVQLEGKSNTINNSPKLFIESITMSGALFVVLILIAMGAEINALIPLISAFAVAAIRILPGINRISVCYSQIPFLEGGLDTIISLILHSKETTGIFCEKDAEEISFENEIVFSNITYAYDDSEKTVLQNATFSIQRGQSVGLIGPSGAGKTTVVDILLGLLKPQGGEVLVDAKNIESNMEGWLKKVAYIPQQIYLLDDTIRKNVAFGITEDEIDEKRIWDVLREAQLEEFTKNLPLGLDTKVGEAGIRLSGGQRQRIGIARALYCNPEILFFDEATSALDTDTETAIMEAINSLKGKKTMVIIAHRLTTIENCDVVYRVENGKIEINI